MTLFLLAFLLVDNFQASDLRLFPLFLTLSQIKPTIETVLCD